MQRLLEGDVLGAKHTHAEGSPLLLGARLDNEANTRVCVYTCVVCVYACVCM